MVTVIDHVIELGESKSEDIMEVIKSGKVKRSINWKSQWEGRIYGYKVLVDAETSPAASTVETGSTALAHRQAGRTAE